MTRWVMVLKAGHGVKWTKNPDEESGRYMIEDRPYNVRPGAAFSREKRIWWTLWTKKEHIEYTIYAEGNPEPFRFKSEIDKAVTFEETMSSLHHLNRSRLMQDILGKSGFDWMTFMFGAFAGLAFGVIGGIVAAHYLIGK